MTAEEREQKEQTILRCAQLLMGTTKRIGERLRDLKRVFAQTLSVYLIEGQDGRKGIWHLATALPEPHRVRSSFSLDKKNV